MSAEYQEGQEGISRLPPDFYSDDNNSGGISQAPPDFYFDDYADEDAGIPIDKLPPSAWWWRYYELLEEYVGDKIDGLSTREKAILVSLFCVSCVVSCSIPRIVSGFNFNAYGQVPVVSPIESAEGKEKLDPNMPMGSPFGDKNVVITQGYDGESHQPTRTMGGIDLAVDENGDGKAEPESTLGAPIYATHAGQIKIYLDTWPGGNCVIIENKKWLTKYCHLDKVAEGLTNGHYVKRGDLIGYAGSTGQSSGPHLHYEVWQSGKNVNPLGQNEPLTKLSDLEANNPISEISINFHYDSGLYTNLQEQLENEAIAAYDYVVRRFGAGAKGDITIYISSQQGCNLNGVADTQFRRIEVRSCNEIPLKRVVAILAHEYVHQLTHDEYGDAHLNADRILLEGIATWGAGKYWLGGTSEDFREYVKKQGIGFPLQIHPYGRSADEINTIYYQWASFVQFLVEEYGWDLFDELYVSGNYEPGSARYQEVYGKSLDDLEKEWREWIDL
ncbi:MAG: M23 family metallopeptidase [Patescibacteria group bacterium]|nr:M23 family metallopeptidase [Patescibacteria group bacterium]